MIGGAANDALNGENGDDLIESCLMNSNKKIPGNIKYLCLISASFFIQNAWSQNLDGKLEVLGTMIPKGFDSSVQIQYQCNKSNKNEAKKCLMDLYEYKANDGEKYKHDSINISIPKGYEILDTNDTNCISTIGKNSEIIAIGILKQEKFKFIASHVVKAWSINPVSMKFQSIKRSTVSCAILEDRN